jgi:cardiolipin synthase
LAFDLAWEDSWPRQRGREHKTLLKHQLVQRLLNSPVRMTQNRRLRIAYRHELLEHFRGAKKRIWILTPYFVPNRALFQALVNAARRGCDVRIVLPGLSDIPMVQWVSSAFYAPLIRAGCRLYHYQRNILHAKTLFVDPWILVGSSNLNYRSLRMDLEVNILPQAEGSKKALEGQFKKDLAHSKELTAEMVRRRPMSVRLLSWLFFRFRFWF